MKRLPIPPKPLSISPAAPPLPLILALCLALPACAQQPAAGEAAAQAVPVSAAPSAPAAEVSQPAEAQPAAPPPAAQPPGDDSPQAQDQTPAPSPGAETAAPASPADMKTPYAFVCVPYGDLPKPHRKTVRKETPLAAPVPVPVVVEAPVEPKPPNSAVISILGKKVFGRDGEDMGRVVDVLADNEGRTRAAVIDFGGFLGVGNRRVAVDWRSLQIDPSNPDKPVILQLSREQVGAAPEFKDSDHPEKAIVIDPSPASAPAAANHPQ